MSSRIELSVNINKYATLRNSRGGKNPSLLWAIDTISEAGAYGITIHPRQDERHITTNDIFEVSSYIRSKHPHLELNIEGDTRPDLIKNILQVKPDQATLVPVTTGEITSDHGYDFAQDSHTIIPVIEKYKSAGIRVSLFVNANPLDMAPAHKCGTDRVEIYTGPYAQAWETSSTAGIKELSKIEETIEAALENDLKINAGHDLDLNNLPALVELSGKSDYGISELSIGHMIICRSLENGLSQTVKDFLKIMRK